MIPDDEPWWMVRANTDNGLASERSMSGDSTLADEHASETIEYLNKLPFRPIGYEW